ncbi:hypothetical protein PR048_025361 [Dryococelus australis]|uniref:Uncharacterized protein n=1 Tax=Dryococelus australis TaxID=614101 RepID=A0ABQ9GR32_9NEOP|nr:hypothetical protein PR048_025361 [Dryococelus australis]
MERKKNRVGINWRRPIVPEKRLAFEIWELVINSLKKNGGFKTVYVLYAANTSQSSVRGHGDVVVRLLALYLGEPGSILGGVDLGFSHEEIVPDAAVGGFSRGSPIFPVLSFLSILTYDRNSDVVIFEESAWAIILLEVSFTFLMTNFFQGKNLANIPVQLRAQTNNAVQITTILGTCIKEQEANFPPLGAAKKKTLLKWRKFVRKRPQEELWRHSNRATRIWGLIVSFVGNRPRRHEPNASQPTKYSSDPKRHLRLPTFPTPSLMSVCLSAHGRQRTNKILPELVVLKLHKSVQETLLIDTNTNELICSATVIQSIRDLDQYDCESFTYGQDHRSLTFASGEKAAYGAKTRTAHASKMASLVKQYVAAQFANQRLVTCHSSDSPANREPSAARAAANQTQGQFQEISSANQRMGTPVSKEPLPLQPVVESFREIQEAQTISRSFNLTQGTAIAERLACSPLTKANRVQSPAGSLPDFRMWESCRTMLLVCLPRGRNVTGLASARLHHRGSKIDPRSHLGSTQKTVAPFELRAGLEIEMKFISNRRNRRFQISVRDQQPSSTNIEESEIQNHEISLVQHFYIRTKIKLDHDSELGSFDLGLGRMFVQPGITEVVRPRNLGGKDRTQVGGYHEARPYRLTCGGASRRKRGGSKQTRPARQHQSEGSPLLTYFQTRTPTHVLAGTSQSLGFQLLPHGATLGKAKSRFTPKIKHNATTETVHALQVGAMRR